MDYIEQITRALNKEMENVAILAHFPASKLEKKLSLIRRQSVFAQQNRKPDALDLLRIWEKQILEAGILKREMKIEDNLKLEMPMHLPEIEAYEMIEKRQELLRQKLLKEKFPEIDSHPRSDSTQTNLF